MAEEVGAVELALKLNSSDMSKQLKSAAATTGNQATSSFAALGKKLGLATAAYFSVKAITGFTASCLELGSNLTEVQNVVDTTFGSMSSQVNSFASGAMEQFGLSETIAKKYMGTLGAMSKSMGFTTQASYDMAKGVTGMAGDVASFYNMSSDDAYTKLKSIWTGETESLKEIGVVMSQTNLDQYALNNGFGKTTASMTEQAKTMLRYQYVMSSLSAAQGDFAKTSDSWANQTRVLSLRFDALKATLGQGFIALFTPIIRMLNSLMSSLNKAAGSFTGFIQSITGYNAAGSSAASTAAQTAAAISDVGTSATTTAKQIEKSLAGFDQVNKLSDVSTDPGAGATTTNSTPVDTSGLTSSIDTANAKLTKTQTLLQTCKNLLKSGFSDGLGKGFDKSVQNTKDSISNIKTSLVGIFSSPDVTKAAMGFGATASYALGQIAGSAASIGASAGELLTGGIANYLKANSGFIASSLSGILGSMSSVAKTAGNTYKAVGTIFESLRSSKAKSALGNLVGIFSNSMLGIQDILGKVFSSAYENLAKPIIDNSELIKTALTNLFGNFSVVFGAINSLVLSTFDGIGEMYTNNLKPFLDAIGAGISSIVNTFMTGYNTYIQPVLNNLAGLFESVVSNHIKPAVDSFISMLGNIINYVKILWTEAVQPFVDWIIKNIIPVVAPIIDTIGAVFANVFGVIFDVVKSAIDIIGNLFGFVVNVFTGNWGAAWTNVKNIFSAVVSAIGSIISGLLQNFAIVWEGIKSIFAPVANFFGSLFGTAVDKVKSVWSGVTGFFTSVWSGIKAVFSVVTDWFSDVFTSAWRGVKNVFSAAGNLFVDIKDGITDFFKTTVNGLIKGINSVISVPFNGINSALKMIKGISIMGMKPFNGIVSTISVPQIPYLAQGGYVKANTPQLAMIGDNRHQGEVVAPEDKLKAMAMEAVAAAGGGVYNAAILETLKMILEILKNLDLDIVIDGVKLKDIIVQKINENTKRKGVCEIIT